MSPKKFEMQLCVEAEGMSQHRAGGMTQPRAEEVPPDAEFPQSANGLSCNRPKKGVTIWLHRFEPIPLTLKQKQVLLWLIRECKYKNTSLLFNYARIGTDLKITKKAARVHVAALEKKQWIRSSIAYRRGNPKQAIGKRMFIPPEVYFILEMEIKKIDLGGW